MLAAASSCLLLVFVATVLMALLPIRLTDPAWQLGFISSIVNNGGFALIGLVLIQFASRLDPANGRLRARCATFRQLAIPAAIGFLLIVPLQGFATLKGLANAEGVRTIQLRQVGQRFEVLREAIRTAPTLGDLQGRLQQLRGPTLQTADLGQPLPQLRQQLVVALKQAETTVKAQIPGLDPARRLGVIKESVRVVVSSLAFAFAFAFGARRPDSPLSLWTELGRGWRQGLKARRISAKERRVARESSGNVAKLLARQEQRHKAWKIDFDRKKKAEAKLRERNRTDR
jgi:hypothetical protein